MIQQIEHHHRAFESSATSLTKPTFGRSVARSLREEPDPDDDPKALTGGALKQAMWHWTAAGILARGNWRTAPSLLTTQARQSFVKRTLNRGVAADGLQITDKV